MPNETPTLLTAGAMAKELGVSDAKVKKAIVELGLVPAAKKGCCNYFTTEDQKKLKAVLG
jgi:predicted transcriptional regulator with HTH domain